MTKLLAIFMVGLFANAGASAEELRGHSNNADNFIGIMAQAGIHNSTLNEVAHFVDGRVENKEFYFIKENSMGYNFHLTHDTAFPDYKDVELRIAPDNSNFALTGNYAEVMVNYRIETSY